ncbi:hypothetical protein VTH06DRAFT_2078 [Thermothelomyces fergusii]
MNDIFGITNEARRGPRKMMLSWNYRGLLKARGLATTQDYYLPDLFLYLHDNRGNERTSEYTSSREWSLCTVWTVPGSKPDLVRRCNKKNTIQKVERWGGSKSGAGGGSRPSQKAV